MAKDQRDKDRQKIYDFMIHKGVDKFWANAALKHIMLNFAGNAYWLTEIRTPKVIIGMDNMISKFTVLCTINTVNSNTKGRLTYTFGRGHKVSVKVIK